MSPALKVRKHAESGFSEKYKKKQDEMEKGLEEGGGEAVWKQEKRKV